MFVKVSRPVLAGFFIVAGSWHFISPATYLPMMPDYLPFPMGLIYLSGLAEIIGGIGVLIPRWRHLAGWWLIALLVAVFPANIHMLVDDVPLAGNQVPQWILWARLPLQLVLIGWVYFSTIRSRQSQKS